ncbi:MAG: type II toxin-antitoxin system RelE/ParE family toxin [Eubacterium sp.]|nr:type II toxin-antitoxin system RelE/ParE family toxin [Eubacterium sp.]
MLKKPSAEVKNVNPGSNQRIDAEAAGRRYKDGRLRLRVGKYRVIYRYTQEGKVEILVIMEIGSRGDIYK